MPLPPQRLRLRWAQLSRLPQRVQSPELNQLLYQLIPTRMPR
jgi:hypothetical protein